MLETVRPFLGNHITGQWSATLINIILLVGIFLVSVSVYYLTKWILRALETLVMHSPTHWDDDLLNRDFMRALSQLSPAMAVRWLIPGLFGETVGSVRWLSAITSLYIVWAIVRVIVIFIGNLYTAFLRRPKLRSYAVKGIFQTVKLIFIGLGIIIGLSILINRSPAVILTALGASAAVLMLVFQDTILGLVASVQLSANRMLKRGDWIESENNGINGEVLDVSLTSVKVRNWDNSVSTIPPYSLVKGSFRNYQPMRSSGGRRVIRPIYIDVNTVRFCTPEEIAALEAKGWLEGLGVNTDTKIVNLQLLRLYLDAYLGKHPEVNQNLTYMVRQLEPTPSGLPLELYFFIRNVEWKAFEGIASTIFDHVYAIVHEFGLSVYQTPAGTDFARINHDSRPCSDRR